MKVDHDCYSVFVDSLTQQPLYGFKKAGKIKIKAKYLATYTDKLCHMAMVLDAEKGWIGIDKNDQILVVPYIYDNGPDYPEEGLFRVVANNKIGFADSTGKQLIPAQFDFVTPFRDGYAIYYIGGEKIYEGGKTEAQIMADPVIEQGDLHWSWGGKIIETGYINKKGRRFIVKSKI